MSYNGSDDPYSYVQQYVAHLANLVANGTITDLQALELILNESIFVIAGGDMRLGLTYAASAFYRSQLDDFNNPFNPLDFQDSSYTRLTDNRFGVTGFNEFYYSDATGNSNQLQHFIGEAALTASYNSQFIGELGALFNDSGTDGIATSDRNLGNLAAWWATSDVTQENLSLVIEMIAEGTTP
ncbi:MAG TPA: hypothetical protein VJ965_00925 [Anaerolineales bacterium]|nr:hypothetical protein [Anaerolineales bacterium]